MTGTVLFVCPHGAGMSRIAAAWFNLVAPASWRATSAGLDPQAELGVNAPRLLAGTAAEPLLDREPPRPIGAVPTPDRVIALCCDADGAERWDLVHREFTDRMRDEIRARTEDLAMRIWPANAGGPPMFTNDTRSNMITVVGQVPLPPHRVGGFDHSDVHLPTGRVFVAHTANDTVDVIDGEHLRLERTLPNCPEGSGVVCAHGATDLVFAAARGGGNVLVVDPLSCQVHRRVSVGPKPNGLAWDPDRLHLLVADVQTYDARLIDPHTGTCLAVRELPGRPRWCVYDAPRQRFLVNVREPACVVGLSTLDLHQVARIDGLPAGPHGLDLDRPRNRVFVACDEGVVTVLDLTLDRHVARIPISGEPDAIWYSTATDRLYVAIGDPGLIEVIDGITLSVVEQLTTEKGAHTTAFDSQRSRLYLFLPTSCQAVVYAERTIGA